MKFLSSSKELLFWVIVPNMILTEKQFSPMEMEESAEQIYFFDRSTTLIHSKCLSIIVNNPNRIERRKAERYWHFLSSMNITASAPSLSFLFV